MLFTNAHYIEHLELIIENDSDLPLASGRGHHLNNPEWAIKTDIPGNGQGVDQKQKNQN